MDDLNKAFIEGRIIRDPELRYTPCGAAVCDVIIASNMFIPRGEGEDTAFKKQTTHLKVTLWNERAKKFAQSLHRGDKILVAGKLVDDNYTLKETNTMTRGRLKMDNIETLRVLEHADSCQEDTMEGDLADV